MNTYDLFWSPEGKKIATVKAESSFKARRMAPEPYRKFPGEIYAVRVDFKDGLTIKQELERNDNP